MASSTCSRCGKTQKVGLLLWSEAAQRWQCASAAACKRRRDRKPQYDRASWANPSFEQQMST